MFAIDNYWNYLLIWQIFLSKASATADISDYHRYTILLSIITTLKEMFAYSFAYRDYSPENENVIIACHCIKPYLFRSLKKIFKLLFCLQWLVTTSVEVQKWQKKKQWKWYILYVLYCIPHEFGHYYCFQVPFFYAFFIVGKYILLDAASDLLNYRRKLSKCSFRFPFCISEKEKTWVEDSICWNYSFWFYDSCFCPQDGSNSMFCWFAGSIHKPPL